MSQTCMFKQGDARCVFGARHTVQYHHLDNGMNIPMGEGVAPPSTGAVIDDFLSKVDEARTAPGGTVHWKTLYDEDDEPYGQLCYCTETGGEDHE